MKVIFSRSWTSTARKIVSGLREKLFDHDDSTSLCHSKTLTAKKRWIPFVFRSSARIPTRQIQFRSLLNDFQWPWVKKNLFIRISLFCWHGHWPYLVVQVYELITCVQLANENAGNLISVVQFLINIIYKLEGFQPWFSKHLSFDNHVDECRSIKLLCTETFFSYLRKWSPSVNNMTTPVMQRKAYNKAMNTNSRAELIKNFFFSTKMICSHFVTSKTNFENLFHKA